MVKLPYRSESGVALPAATRSYPNGQIPKELLHSCGIRNFVMAEPAARACRAMVTAAAADGIRLDATGTYRSYDQQVALFTSRYTKTRLSGRPTKSWNGVTYYQLPNTAMAASPGTSKHGLGLTPDLAQRSSGGALEGVGTATLTWLAAHGPSFGFWNSVTSEPWHWPYFPGDDIPAAVLEMEKSGAIRLPPTVPSDPAERERFYRELPRTGVLSKGAVGPGVEAVQWALTRAGFPTGIDGDFGPATAKAVRDFQQAKKLVVDGVVGADTWAKLGLLADGKNPEENATPPRRKKAAKKKRAAKKRAAKKRAGAKKKGGRKKAAKKKQPLPEHGAVAAAAAAHRAGFDGDDVAAITAIAGRESRWRADAVNPNTSDRGMWQINWKNLQGKGYDELRARLGVDSDTDLLDLDTNAEVAFFMYEDSLRMKKPWFPWRASDKGYKNNGPGWDPDGSHTWHTEEFAAEATAAAKAVLGGEVAAPPTDSKTTTSSTSAPSAGSILYKIGPDDSDGLIAIVSRCLGLTAAPWPTRSAAAEAVAEHNGGTLDSVWQPGDVLAFPAEIDGVRSYEVQKGNGLIAIAKGLGLGGSKKAQELVADINAWQGTTPQPGAIWFGGPAA